MYKPCLHITAHGACFKRFFTIRCPFSLEILFIVHNAIAENDLIFVVIDISLLQAIVAISFRVFQVHKYSAFVNIVFLH